MINALTCKVCSLINIDEYCTNKIQPLLLNSNGQSILFGKYSVDGEEEYRICSFYAKDPPSLHGSSPIIHPFDIKNYLENLGYIVDWIQIKEQYPAGYSGSKKTRYYSSGYNTYYSLKISY